MLDSNDIRRDSRQKEHVNKNRDVVITPPEEHPHKNDNNNTKKHFPGKIRKI